MTNGLDRELILKLATLFVLSILPSLAYLIIVRKLNRRWRSRLRRVRVLNRHRERDLLNLYSRDYHQRLPKRYIGNARCQYNALSPYVRCAVNPSGPCRECSHYQEKKDAC